MESLEGETLTQCAVKIRYYLCNSDSHPLGLSVRSWRPIVQHKERGDMPHACNSVTAVGTER